MVSLIPSTRVFLGSDPEREPGIIFTYLRANPDVLLRDPQSSMPWFAVFVFLIPVLGTVLQLHCQASNSSPFITHPVNMWAWLFALLIFCSSSGYIIKSHFQTTNYTKLATQIHLIAGSLASVSIISILVPSRLEHLVFIAWIPLPIYVVAGSFILRTGQYTYQASKTAILHTWGRIVGSNTITMAAQPQCPV